MSHEFSRLRRTILTRSLAVAVAAAAAVSRRAAAAGPESDGSQSGLPHLSPDDPTAKSLMYVNDAANAGPAHKDDAACHNCRFFKGEGTTGWGPCQIFPNNTVNAQGWCSVWMMKDQ